MGDAFAKTSTPLSLASFHDPIDFGKGGSLCHRAGSRDKESHDIGSWTGDYPRHERNRDLFFVLVIILTSDVVVRVFIELAGSIVSIDPS